MPGKPLKPQDVAPLEAAEFGIAFQIALDSGQDLSNASSSPSSSPPSSSPSSSPWERARFALKQHYAGEEDKFHSADFRFRALMDLYTKDVLSDWVRSSGDASPRTEIHPAVLDVASRLRLASNGKFPVRKFLESVAETAGQNYADLKEWPLNRS